MPPSPGTTRQALEIRNRVQEIPYTTEELQDVVHNAPQQEGFPGLAVLELYTQVAQHLKGTNYIDWLNDGRGYCFLGPTQPS